MQSSAKTVAAYLKELPPDRRAGMQVVRAVIQKHLPAGYEEAMQYGMMGWVVPHRLFPAGYHCDPTKALPFMGLASQKQAMSLYLVGCYGFEAELAAFRAAAEAAGKKLNMGKTCIRFKKPEDLPLDLIGKFVASFPVKKYIAGYLANLARR